LLLLLLLNLALHETEPIQSGKTVSINWVTPDRVP